MSFFRWVPEVNGEVGTFASEFPKQTTKNVYMSLWFLTEREAKNWCENPGNNEFHPKLQRFEHANEPEMAV